MLSGDQAQLQRRLTQAALILVGILIAISGFYVIQYVQGAIRFILNVLSPFLLAIILAYLFNPIIRHLQVRFRMRRMSSVLVAYFLILSIMATLVLVMIPAVAGGIRSGARFVTQKIVPEMQNQMSKLGVAADNLGISQESLERFLSSYGIPTSSATDDETTTLTAALDAASTVTATMNETLAGSPLQSQLATSVAKGAAPAAQQLTVALRNLVGGAGVLVAGFGGFVIGTLAFITFVALVTFYVLVEYVKLSRLPQVLLTQEKYQKVNNIWGQMDTALGGFLRGQLTVSSIIFGLYSGALFLLGMGWSAVVIGFVAGFGNMIPYFGPIAGAVPTSLWVLFSDTYVGFGGKMFGLSMVLLLTVAIQTLDGFYLQPRIVGKNAELHPLVVLAALFVGGQFGIGGLIIAVPVAIITRVLMLELWWRPLVAKREEEGVFVDEKLKCPPPNPEASSEHFSVEKTK